MNKLIERYVFDVVRRLPEKDREEVQKELISNISDMLPDEPDENTVIKVLNGMGNPARLAEKYRQNPRYLISPAMFDDYLSILKLVFMILSTVLFAAGLIGDFAKLSATPEVASILTAIFINLLEGVATGASSAFLWVTLAFFVAEQIQTKHTETEWTVKNLAALPTNNGMKISQAETMVGMALGIVFNALFLVMVILYPQAIGWYEAGKDVIPLLNEQIIRGYVPMWIFLALFSVAVSALKLYDRKWTWRLVAINGIYNIASTTFALIFLHTPSLFNEAFIQRLAEAVNQSFSATASYWNRGVLMLSAIIIIAAVVDFVQSIWKVFKGQVGLKVTR